MTEFATSETPVNWRTLIQSAKDLETQRESTRQGFIDQANEKSKSSCYRTPYAQFHAST